MKKILILPAALFVLCSVSTLQARPGFTAGVYSGMATVEGPMTKSIEDERQYMKFMQTMKSSNYTSSYAVAKNALDYSNTGVATAAVSLQYEFKNGFFVRTGFEYYDLVMGKEIEYNEQYYDTTSFYRVTSQMKFSYSQRSAIVPVCVGFSLYPKKASVGVYGALGGAVGVSNVEKMEDSMYVNFSNVTMNVQESSSAHTKFEGDDQPIFGLTGLLGIEWAFAKNVSLSVEYVFNQVEVSKMMESRTESQKFTSGMYSNTNYESQTSEIFGVPSQAIRFGVRFTL